MCSFDVSSLFTNVPLGETILLVFATKRSHFVFDGQYYDQVDGVAMGSPLGLGLANIFMCHFEDKWVINSSDCPNVWFRYRYRSELSEHRTRIHTAKG